MPKLGQKGIAHVFLILLLLVGLGLGVFLVSQRTNLKPKASLSDPTQPESSISLVADQTTYTQGSLLPIKIMVRSDVDSTNLIRAKLNFTQSEVEVVSITKNEDIITNWIEEYYTDRYHSDGASNGTISLAGGITSPGYKTNNTPFEFATVTIRSNAPSGPTSFLNVWINDTDYESSAIFRNSDNQNILSTKRNLSLNIVNQGASPTSAPTEEPTPTASPSPSLTPEPTPTSSPAVVPGDGDGNKDGRVNLIDMSLLLTHWFSGLSDPINVKAKGVDMNGDEVINTFDFGLLRQKLLELGVIRQRST